MSNHVIVYKSNWLVGASYKLSLQEQRFILSCIAKVDPEKEMPKTIVLSASEFYLNFPDMGRQNAEAELKQAVDRLWDRAIVVKDPECTKEFRWIQERATYHSGEGRVSITFSSSVTQYLTQLKQQFTKFTLKNVSGLGSAYSIRIYELLHQFISTGHRMIMLDDLRDTLQIKDKYQEFRELNRVIIKPAVKDLNAKSNLSVSVNQIKQGRKTIGLHFYFSEKNSSKSKTTKQLAVTV